MPQITEIIAKAKAFLPHLDEARVMRAYQFAEEAHAGQTRFSGEPYIIHPLHVTTILLEFHPDENTIVSALLHDVAEDTAKTLEDIEVAFGAEVRSLCWGMVKLSKVRSKLNDPQVENLRKLFLAMAKDFRVVLLKLCDRLHNMRTLEHVRPEKRTRIAQETLFIFAPIAARLGIYRLKSQLEDLCFKYLFSEDFQSIQEQIEKTGKWREKYIEHAKKILHETMADDGIQANVDGRVKSLYSIFRKLQKKNKHSIEEIFDVFAMRIILPDIYKHGKEYSGHLYTALGILHNRFTPLANRFKDYIAVPKVNGYRSLHTTVMGLGPKTYTQPTEVQIRTQGMHEYAEFGIAAHWMYEGDELLEISSSLNTAMASSMSSVAKKQRDWISGLQQIEQEIKSNPEFMENLSVDIFNDRIFVLTPRGDVKDLPVGASTIDFAYSVHTDVGNHCIGAKVNGVGVPLDYQLKNGEVVEIVTRKNAVPNQSWLGFAKTNHARNRIRGWFRDLDVEKQFRDGRALLNEKLLQFGRSVLDDQLGVLRLYDGKKLTLKERQEIVCEVGRGAVLPGAVLKKILTLEELIMGREPRRIKKPSSVSKEETPKLLIGGEENMPYQFVRCCDAGFGDELVGYITRGRGVSLHRKTCGSITKAEEARLIPVRIAGSVSHYPVGIRVEIDDRFGMIRDISKTIAERKINIIDVAQDLPRDGRANLDFVVEVANFDQLELVLADLEKIPNVRRAWKVN